MDSSRPRSWAPRSSSILSSPPPGPFITDEMDIDQQPEDSASGGDLDDDDDEEDDNDEDEDEDEDDEDEDEDDEDEDEDDEDEDDNEEYEDEEGDSEEDEATPQIRSRRQQTERKLLKVVRLLRRLRWSFDTLLLVWTGATQYSRTCRIRSKAYATPGKRRQAVYRALTDPRYQAVEAQAAQANQPAAASDITGELDGLIKLPHFGKFDHQNSIDTFDFNEAFR